MKIGIALLLLAAGCSKSRTAPGVTEHTVAPHTVDAAVTAYNEPHYTYYRPAGDHRNQLVLFLPGTGAEPKHYRRFVQRAAERGYHAIALMYPNEPAINQLCAGSGDVTSHSRARLEIIDGTDRHPGVTVNAANSIIQRLVKLLAYLQQQYPAENWGQFITGGAPRWNQLIVAGHSQGAGHAGVIGKHYDVQRVILFSGMDFLTNGQTPDWVASTARKERYFALHHLQDELLPIDIVKKGWLALGMGAPADAAGPFNQAQALQTTVAPAWQTALKHHNATVVDVYVPQNGALHTAWDYLLP